MDEISEDKVRDFEYDAYPYKVEVNIAGAYDYHEGYGTYCEALEEAGELTDKGYGVRIKFDGETLEEWL